MAQDTASPMRPRKAMQRQGAPAVPRMHANCALIGSVNPAGTRPPGMSSISSLCSVTR